nr:predicted GPI-anchored protein 58 [Aegilops tauschii subsp. strangulata]
MATPSLLWPPRSPSHASPEVAAACPARASRCSLLHPSRPTVPASACTRPPLPAAPCCYRPLAWPAPPARRHLAPCSPPVAAPSARASCACAPFATPSAAALLHVTATVQPRVAFPCPRPSQSFAHRARGRGRRGGPCPCAIRRARPLLPSPRTRACLRRGVDPAGR